MSADIPQCMSVDFVKRHLMLWGREWLYCKDLYYVFRFMCYVDYNNDKFMYPPTYTYNKVMWLSHMVGVVESE